MIYQINFEHYKHNFALPFAIVQKDLAQIPSDYLKIILMIFQSPDKEYSVHILSVLLSLPEETVEKGIKFWIERGVLLPKKEQEISFRILPAASKVTTDKPENDSELQYLISSMQQILGRCITSTDAKTMTYIYEYYRLPADVILMAVQYAVSKGKTDVRYIEKLCIHWYDQKITNHELAEEYLKQMAEQNREERKIKQLLGIQDRNLIAYEQKCIQTWRNEYRFSPEVIAFAYEKTVKALGKLSFPYMNKILQNWHKKGLHTPEEVQAEGRRSLGKRSDKKTASSFDVDDIDQYWDKVPTLRKETEV